jgi:hypothetical protein
MTEMQPPHCLCLLSGIIAIANAIPNMGALTKLDISGNTIKQGETLEQITTICLTKRIELTVGTSFD